MLKCRIPPPLTLIPVPRSALSPLLVNVPPTQFSFLCPNRFYPYHYAPFTSDLINIDSFELKFELGAPFSPLEQLMGVFPARRSGKVVSAV